MMKLPADYDELLLSAANPFPFPDPPEKPEFMVGAEAYVQWFTDWFSSSLPEKKLVSYVVGFPGAGKSHLLKHLYFLTNDRTIFPGIFTIYEAGRSTFESRDLWYRFLSDQSALTRLRSLLTAEEIENAGLSATMKKTLLELVGGEKSIYELPDEVYRDSISNLSRLLSSKNVGICLAIDNVDEHFRFMAEKVETRKIVDRLAGVLRDTTVGVKQIAILLGCTTTVYDDITKTPADMTFLRRVESQDIKLQELSESQCIELVKRYLEAWASKHSVTIPVHADCRIDGDETSSIYPFTPKAIQYFYAMTRKYAGDIVASCSHSIDLLKRGNRVTTFSQDQLTLALRELYAKRKFVILDPELLAPGGYTLREETLGRILESCYTKVVQRYSSLVDEAKVVRGIDEFATQLGIVVEAFSPVRNYRRSQEIVSPNDKLKVWKFHDFAVAVKHLTARSAASDRMRTENVVSGDYIDVASVIEAGQATQGLLTLSWVNSFPASIDKPDVLHIQMEFGEVIATFGMHQNSLRILAAIEEGGKDKDELLRYIEKFHVRLIPFLETLVQQKRPQFSSGEYQQKLRRELGGAYPPE